MGLDPKVSQKLPLRLNKKQVNSENLGKNNEAKKKAFGRNIKKNYEKPPKHPLISKVHLHV
jgi:hypothetical protein